MPFGSGKRGCRSTSTAGNPGSTSDPGRLALPRSSKEVSGARVPALRVDAEVLRRLPLSAPERYLLARVDGQRTVEAIIQVSPIHELDALRCFRGFLDQGLVELRGS